jgi:hypothetical protein
MDKVFFVLPIRSFAALRMTKNAGFNPHQGRLRKPAYASNHPQVYPSDPRRAQFTVPLKRGECNRKAGFNPIRFAQGQVLRKPAYER